MEAMVAIAIIAIGVMSMYVLQVSSINTNSSGNRITISTNVAADKIEEILAMDYTDDDLKYDDADPDIGDYTVTDADSNVINWTVTAGPVANTKSITISVTTGRDTSTITYLKSDL